MLSLTFLVDVNALFVRCYTPFFFSGVVDTLPFNPGGYPSIELAYY